MNHEQWTTVERYITDHLSEPDPVLDAALTDSTSAGLPAIAVSPNEGKLLNLLAQIQGARTILELGTLGGYSTIWLARALPADGRLITLEANPEYAAVATANIARAGLEDVVELRVGAALDTLPELAAEQLGPFDLIFIDADKQNMAAYLTWAIELSRPGTLILADNVVRNGAILDPDLDDGYFDKASVEGVQQMYAQLADESRVSATAIQTVGSKGYDGFAVIRVK